MTPMWSYVLLLMLPLTWGCPKECRCRGMTADCSNAGLTSVPEFLNRDSIYHLDLSGNRISKLTNRSLEHVAFLTSLDLSRNEIASIEISAFDKQGSLKNLNLSHNHLQVYTLSDKELFRGCRSVAELDLSYNRLESIPVGIKILTSLTRLHIQYNQMRNVVLGPDFRSLDVLEYIDMSGNLFSEVPEQTFQIIKQNQKVKTINLSNCRIRRIDSGVFASMRQLQEVDLSDNPQLRRDELNVTITEICQSAELRSLRLANTNITSLAGLLNSLRDTDIRDLDLSRNHLRVLNASDLKPARKLENLSLRENRIVELPGLSLPQLQRLDLAYNSITKISLEHFEDTADLVYLDLSNNQLTEFTSESFSRNTKLDTLDVSYNYISTIYPVAHLEYLKKLKIRGNKITDPRNLFYLISVTEMDLGYNQIAELPSDLFPGVIDLTSLNLTHNKISSIDRSTFSQWTPSQIDLSYNSLRELDDYSWSLAKTINLQWNQIEHISSNALADLQWVERLDLSHNKLTTLPRNMFSQLTQLSSLNLAHNELGEYLLANPEAKSLFAADIRINIEYLSLRDNKLETIADNFFTNLTRLRSLDLAYNSLDEITAKQLHGLSMLQELDLSYNNLTAFDTSTVSALVSLERIDLSRTYWRCDCELAAVKNWLESASVEAAGYTSPGRYVCYSPAELRDTPLAEFDPSHSQCQDTFMEKTIILIVIGCTSFIILIVAGIIFWQHRWRLKKRLKKQHYRAMYERSLSQTQGPNGPLTQTDYSHPPNLPTRVNCVDSHHHSAAFV